MVSGNSLSVQRLRLHTPNTGSAGWIPVRELRSLMWHGIATKINKQKCGFWACRTVSRCGTLGASGLSTTGPQEKLAWAIPTHSPSLGFSPAWVVRFRQHTSAPCPSRAVLRRASRCNWGPVCWEIHRIYCKSERGTSLRLYSFGGPWVKISVYRRNVMTSPKRRGRLGYWRGFLYTFKMY